MKTLVASLLLGACLLPLACSGPTAEEAVADLQAAYDAGSHEAVVADAPALVERCKAEGVDAWKVEKLRLQSMAKLGRGDDLAGELDRLDGAYAGKVKAQLYQQLGGYVTDSGNLSEAIAVLHAGAEKYPEHKDAVFMPQIEDLTRRAEAAGDSGTLASLKALGYL